MVDQSITELKAEVLEDMGSKSLEILEIDMEKEEGTEETVD